MVSSIKVGTVELPLVQCEVKRGKENKGKKYPALDFSKITFKNLIDAYGETKLFEDLLQPKFNQFAQAYWFGSIDEKTKEPNEDEFMQNLAALSARGETSAVLLDRLMGLITQLANCTTIEEFTSVSSKVRSIKEAIETKKNKTQQDLADEAEAVGVATA